MYIYAYFGRARSAEDAQQICAIFGRLSSSQLAREPGYRRGECAVDLNEPRQVFIHEHWGSLPATQSWLASGAHRTAIEQAKQYLEGENFETHVYEVLSGGPS